MICNPDQTSAIKSLVMRWASHVARMRKRGGAYGVVVVKSGEKRPSGTSTRTWDSNIKI